MGVTNVGTLLINDALPDDLRKQEGFTFDKKGIHDLLRQVAEKHPAQYKEILKKLNDIGRSTVYSTGASVSLSGLAHSEAKERVLSQARQKIQQIVEDESIPQAKKDDAIVQMLLPLGPQLQDALYQEAKQEDNPYYLQLISGARGKKSDYNSLRGADLLTSDHNGKVIPVPIFHSYAEGLDPVEYWAGLYGQRRGMIGVKFCLAGDTEVLMADYGVKRISDIRVGDLVMGAGPDGRLRPTAVTNVWDNGIRACYRYRFRKNHTQTVIELVATEDHKILARTERGEPVLTPLREARLTSPRPSRSLTAVPIAGVTEHGGVDEPHAMILGLLLGDGCVSPSVHNVLFSCGDASLLADIEPELARLGKRLVKLSKQPNQYTYALANKEALAVKTMHGADGRLLGTESQCSARALCEKYGMYGKYAHEKTLPDTATWSAASVGNLVGGLFSADGCVEVRKGGVSLTIVLTSEKMIRELQHILEYRFGIWSSVNEVRMRGNMRHQQWLLRITMKESVERFATNVRLVGKKKLTLEQAMLRPEGCRRARAGFSLLGRTYVGEIPTYDIEVEHEHHAFALANGLIVANSVGDAGFLNKQLVNAAHRITVSRDNPEPTRLPVGLPVDPKDPDNAGAVLAMDAGPYKAGQVLTPAILKDLQEKGSDEIVIHSPLTEQTPDGGVSRLAAGKRDRFDLSKIGDNIGIPAAQAIGEKLSQGMLSSKHNSGVAGTDRVNRAGFEFLNRLIQAPESFPEAGPLAEEPGVVSSIEKAPQGGHFIGVGQRKYYVHDGLKPVVKIGDHVDHGDDLTDGVPHPNDLVRHRGIGEARRVYTNLLREALDNSGIGAHRRNLETVVAGLINWAKVNDHEGIGEHLPDDVVWYNQLAHQYKPRQDATLQPVRHSVGRFLEEPALHYSIGTRITKKVAQHLDRHGIKDVYSHHEAPGFEPYMQRGLLGVHEDPDWMTQLGGFYTTSAFNKSVARGAESDPNSTSFVPALARGEGFGKNLGSTGHYGG